MSSAYSEKYSEFTGFLDILDKGKYVDRLDEKSKKKAQEELCEKPNPKDRDDAIQQFRDWVKAQPHYSVCTEDTFLLAFLRRCRYSQLEARTMFDIFHSVTYKKIPSWMVDVDTSSAALKILIDTKALIIPPYRDPEGRRILIWRGGAFDAGKKSGYTPDTMFQLWGITLMILQREDMTQVNGYVLMQDGTGMTMKHIGYPGIDRFKAVIKVFYNNFPARIKKVIYYNCGVVMEGLMALVLPFVSQKIKDRFVVRTSMEEIFEKDLPMECFPREYLPDDYTGKCGGTLDEMCKKFYDKHREPAVQKKIWDISHNYFKVDEDKRPDTDVPQATFRKLNID